MQGKRSRHSHRGFANPSKQPLSGLLTGTFLGELNAGLAPGKTESKEVCFGHILLPVSSTLPSCHQVSTASSPAARPLPASLPALPHPMPSPGILAAPCANALVTAHELSQSPFLR